MNDQQHQSSSIQINFSLEAARHFLMKTKSLIKKDDLYGQNTGMGMEDNPHVTILYGLYDVNPPLCVIDTIETYPKFVVTLGGISLFKSEDTDNPFDVIKVDILSSDLYVLNSSLRDECEYTTEFSEYMPHATIAFVKPNSHDHLDGLNSMVGLSFLVNNAVFSSQNGTHRFIPFGVR